MEPHQQAAWVLVVLATRLTSLETIDVESVFTKNRMRLPGTLVSFQKGPFFRFLQPGCFSSMRPILEGFPTPGLQGRSVLGGPWVVLSGDISPLAEEITMATLQKHVENWGWALQGTRT